MLKCLRSSIFKKIYISKTMQIFSLYYLWIFEGSHWSKVCEPLSLLGLMAKIKSVVSVLLSLSSETLSIGQQWDQMYFWNLKGLSELASPLSRVGLALHYSKGRLIFWNKNNFFFFSVLGSWKKFQFNWDPVHNLHRQLLVALFKVNKKSR